MASFKAKLVVYFLLLSLLPLAAVFWAFSSVATRGETHGVDTRLESGLRAGVTALQQTVDSREALVERLAHEPEFQRALEHSDLRTIRRLLRGVDDVEVLTLYGKRIGPPPPLLSLKQQASVSTVHGLVGSVIAFVPFDNKLTARLRKSSGLTDGDAVAILDGSRIVASTPLVYGTLAPKPGTPHTLSVGGVRYRVLAAGSFDEFKAVRLLTLSPQHAIDSASGSTRDRLFLFLALVLVAVGLIAYTQGRNIASTLGELVGAANAIAHGRLEERVPVHGRDEFAQLGHAFNDMAGQLQERLVELEAERKRLREAFARFGDALSATHDPDQLLRVVLDATLEATGSTGAALIGDRGELAQVGDIDAPGDRLELPLTAGQSSFGTLVLVGPGFGDEERLTANSLAAHAVVALENARLHTIVERQALVDGLTGLANRRRCEEALSAELARAQRFGSQLTAIFADLDDFKRVNDEYGHRTGDLVLREFAAVLRESVREADVAGRWGGEEFLLLLPGTSSAGGVQLAERIRGALESRVILSQDGAPIQITVSLGVATYPAAPDADALLGSADEALYRAKRDGKNRVDATSEAARRP